MNVYLCVRDMHMKAFTVVQEEEMYFVCLFKEESVGVFSHRK